MEITKGTFTPYPSYEAGKDLHEAKIDVTTESGQKYLHAKTFGDTKEEATDNAELIAEAFNVANETGLSPRQLVDENKELLGALQSITGFVVSLKLLGQFKGVEEDATDEIVQATNVIEAINRSTKQ